MMGIGINRYKVELLCLGQCLGIIYTMKWGYCGHCVRKFVKNKIFRRAWTFKVDSKFEQLFKKKIHIKINCDNGNDFTPKRLFSMSVNWNSILFCLWSRVKIGLRRSLIMDFTIAICCDNRFSFCNQGNANESSLIKVAVFTAPKTWQTTKLLSSLEECRTIIFK